MTPTATAAPVEPAADTVPETPVAATVDQTADLRPGDVQVSGDRPFVSPIESTPESTLESTIEPTSEPAVDSATGGSGSLEPVVLRPDAPVGVPDAAAEAAEPLDGGSYRPLYWLAGTGAALLFGLMLFGRRLRRDAGTAPDAPDTAAPDIADDDPTANNPALADVD